MNFSVFECIWTYLNVFERIYNIFQCTRMCLQCTRMCLFQFVQMYSNVFKHIFNIFDCIWIHIVFQCFFNVLECIYNILECTCSTFKCIFNVFSMYSNVYKCVFVPLVLSNFHTIYRSIIYQVLLFSYVQYPILYIPHSLLSLVAYNIAEPK
jgi:hypothetical protein